MTQYSIIHDLNRCAGCLACTSACKMANNVPIGSFWNKVLRIGPNLKEGGAGFPDVEYYFLTVQCQHCIDPECVKVCPTGASQKMEDGTVQIDKSKCIGCQFCAMACPYNVRYLNEEEGVVEKCTLCEQKVAQGELPQCVDNCVGMAKWFGDLDKTDISEFEGPTDHYGERIKMGSYIQPYQENNIHKLPDVGNNPSFSYILRDIKWQGSGE